MIQVSDQVAESLGKYIRQLRLEHNWALRDVEEATHQLVDTREHISNSYLSAVEQGRRMPSATKLLGLAKVFGLGQEEYAYLQRLAGYALGGSPGGIRRTLSVAERLDMVRRKVGEAMQQLLPTTRMISIPSLEQVLHAPSGAVSSGEVFMPFAEVRNRRLATAVVRGDCMEPTVPEGSRLVIDLDASPQIGDVVVVVLNGDEIGVHTLSGFDDGIIHLQCENPSYPDIATDDFRLAGVVIQVVESPKRKRRRRA